MADEDARRGFRALISGGMFSMDDDALTRLQESAAQAQRERGQTPKLDEIEYLEKYSAICERRLNLETARWAAIEELEELNERFKHLPESFRRRTIPGSGNLVDADEYSGWESSSYSC